MLRSARTLAVVIPLLLLALPAGAEFLHAKGKLQVPIDARRGTEIGDEVDVIPAQTLKGETISFEWKLRYFDSSSDSGRDGQLVLYTKIRVPEGTPPQFRVDMAFFDDAGELIHTWYTDHYSIESTEGADLSNSPTWNVVPSSSAARPWQDLLRMRSWQITVRTVEQ